MSSFGKEGEAAGKTSCGSFSSCRGCAVIENWRQSYGMGSYMLGMGSFTAFRMTRKRVGMGSFGLRPQDDKCVRDDNGRRRNFSEKNSAAFFSYSLFKFNQLIFWLNRFFPARLLRLNGKFSASAWGPLGRYSHQHPAQSPRPPPQYLFW